MFIYLLPVFIFYNCLCLTLMLLFKDTHFYIYIDMYIYIYIRWQLSSHCFFILEFIDFLIYGMYFFFFELI